MENEELKYKIALFGKEIEITVYDIEEKKANRIIDKTHKEALRLQKIFNFYDKESELSLLNKERKLKVSQELLEILTKSISIAKITKGNYDPSLGKYIKQRKESQKEEKILASYKDILIEKDLVILKNENILLDFGSIAKGYITDKIGEFLKMNKVNEFMIDSRGDILFSGKINHIVPIQHPRKDIEIHKIRLTNQAVATSGDYNQYYSSFNKSHILNKKEIISATVVADTLDQADVFATALIVTEKKLREKILRENPDIKAFLITDSLKEEFYNNFEELIDDA